MITMRLRSRTVDAALRRLEWNPRKAKKLLNTIADEEIRNAQQRIVSTKRTPDEQRWAPWAPSTRRQRVRERTAHRGLLYRTGRLLRSFKKVIGLRAAVIKSNALYAGYLQLGTRRMPARPFLGFNERSKEFARETAKRLSK